MDASDGELGSISDFIVDDELWVVRYMVIDTGGWLPGRKVLVSPDWVKDVAWSDSAVSVDLSQSQIEGCPEYDPSKPVNRRYEVRLYDYYGRPGYW